MGRLKGYSAPTHLNGNVLCAIDLETTGTLVGHHDIIEIAILPLDSFFKPSVEIMPVNITMQPRQPENIDPKALSVNRTKLIDIMANSITSDRAADLLVQWFNQLNLGFRKRLSPIGHNWKFDHGFLVDWLGQTQYDEMFDSRYRDVMAASLFINDYSDIRNERIPFPKVNLKYLASQFKIDYTEGHTALGDCRITAEVYRRMLYAFTETDRDHRSALSETQEDLIPESPTDLGK